MSIINIAQDEKKILTYPFYTPRKLCLWWVYCFHVVRASVRNILFPYYREESSLDFHQTLQTCSYMQDKHFEQ